MSVKQRDAISALAQAHRDEGRTATAAVLEELADRIHSLRMDLLAERARSDRLIGNLIDGRTEDLFGSNDLDERTPEGAWSAVVDVITALPWWDEEVAEGPEDIVAEVRRLVAAQIASAGGVRDAARTGQAHTPPVGPPLVEAHSGDESPRGGES